MERISWLWSLRGREGREMVDLDLDLRSRSNVEVANGTHAVQTVFESSKGRGLREEPEEAVKAFVEMRVFFGLEELEAEIWDVVLAAGYGLWEKEYVHVKTGDSRSCTSLSIWMSMLIVISSSALLALAIIQQFRASSLTISGEDCKLARKLEQAGTRRM
jgi:hypothetical protein